MRAELKINVKIVAKVIDGKTGKIKEKREVDCHTFLKNFSELALLIFSRGDILTTRSVDDIGGTSRNVSFPSANNFVDYTFASGYKMKCRIGTNTTAFDRDQYDVLTYLASMEYSEYAISDTGSQKGLQITFAWTNTTGVSKDVSEAVLTAYFYSVAAPYQIAITRDVFAPAITVPNGDVLAMGYVITIPW